MSAEHHLQHACELAYSVARNDAETDPAFEAPQQMRSFLYVTKLPRRAITLAQQIIEEDAGFRERVASRASEENVGKAGMLWLYRPAGWASEFDQITNGSGPSPEELTTDFDYEPAIGSRTTEFDADPISPESNADSTADHVSGDFGSEIGPEIGSEIGSEVNTKFGGDYSSESGGDYANQFASSEAETSADVAYNNESVESEWAGDESVASVTPIGGHESYEASSGLVDSGLADSDLVDSTDPTDLETDTDDYPPLAQTVNEPTYLGNVAVSEQPYFPEPETDISSFSDAEGDLRESTEVDYESDAFESELSSLRGLVNRLKDERDHVVTPVDDESVAALAGVSGTGEDISALQSDLESSRHELSLAQTELSIARQEREEAQRQQSEALKRQVDLEKELSVTRQELHSLDQQAAQGQTEIIGLKDQLKRVEVAAADGDRSKNVLQSQLESMTAERAQLREERTELKSERDDLLLRIADVEAKTGGIDVGELTASNRSLTTELEQVTRDLARSTTQIQTLDERLKVATQNADTFKSEKIDLSSRLADAELNLETKTTQYDAARTDNEKLASSVGSLRAERDGLQTQLSELQSSLADVLNEQAETRQILESDRVLKNEIRAERDSLLARVNAFEQADEETNTKLLSVTKERDDLIVERDEVMEERGRLRGEASAAATEREQLMERISALEATQTSLATEVQAERRQREELATRILEFDETSAQDKAELARYLEERESLIQNIESLKEAQAASTEIKLDRDRLQRELVELQRRTGEDADRATLKITEMSDQMASSENERIAYQREISELKAQLQSVKVDFGELSREAAQLRLSASTPTTSLRSVPDVSEVAAPADEVVQPEPAPDEVETAVADGLASSEDANIEQSIDAELEHRLQTDTPANLEGNIFGTDGAPEAGSDVSSEPETPGEQLASAPAAQVEPTMPLSVDDVANAGQQQGADPTWAPPTEEQIEDPWADPAADVSDDPSWNRPGVVAGSAAGMAGAVGLAGAASEPDELDEVGDLISQAVNQFDNDGSELAVSDEAPSDDARSIFSMDESGPTASQDAVTGGLRRRQIEVPNDILDDEIAVAQFVVSSPDVVLLVDGDAVAKLGWPSLPVAQQRDALVTYLASLSASSGAAPDVVFDGRIGDDDSLPASRAVRIRLSTPPTEPAAALDELVDAYPEQWPIALVTDDQSLTQQAIERGATVLNNGQLLDLFIGE